ncbi:MAG: hypothetical protein SGBAC_004098 [Bacillariaceae sp.]
MESSTGNGENQNESKAQEEDMLPYSGMTESPKNGEVKYTSIPSSVQTNVIQKQISDLMTDSMRKEGGINEGNQQNSAGAQTGTAPFSNRAEAAERPLPEGTASGSFRFYSDEGVVAPDDGAHLHMFSQRSATVAGHENEEKHVAENPDICPDLALPRTTSSESNFANSRDDDNISITNSVVNKPKPGMDNRVSSRLILAQSAGMVPVNHSRGSEVTSKVKGFETMKLHLSTIVRAAETHLQATMELKTAQQMFFASLIDIADDTPLKGVVGTAANHGLATLLNPQQVGVAQDLTLTEKYQREILRHAQDWQEACNEDVARKVKEYQELERRYFHCNTNTARLRKRANNADSWNLEFVLQKIQPRLEKSEAELAVLVQEHKEKANEVCFLLDEVTAHGWKDLYPMVESTMEWEVDRFHQNEDTNGQALPATLEKLESRFQMMQEEELNQPRSLHGIAHVPQVGETMAEGLEEAKLEEPQEASPQLQIDPSKPTLFLDDADPFTARVWIALLEKEADPLHPTGFHVIPVCNIDSEDPGLKLLYSMNQKTSPVLVHNGNIFADSIRVSEYIDKAIRNPLYHSIPSLLPSSPIDTFNMKTFLKRHTRISDVFYNLMDSDDDDARPQLAQELFDLLGLIDKDLQKFPGPYLCGSQFTLADVSIFPFVEHINIILASFGGASIPESLSHLLEWYEVVSRRPSVQMVTADPTNARSNARRKRRGEYLIEYHRQRCDYAADA